MLHYGEGQNFFTMGIPEISLVPAPYYLCVVSKSHEMEKFSIDLMTEQTETFAKLIEKIENFSAKEIGRSDFYSIIKANSVSGGYNWNLKGLVERISNAIKKWNKYLLHDSIAQLILTLISQNGDYVVYSNIISEFLLGSEKFEYKLNSKDFLALKLLCESNPKQCFLHFKEMFLVKSEQLEIEFALLGSAAYCSDLCVQTEENTRFMATKIISLLVSNAKLQSAQRLCHTIYKVFLQHLEEFEQIEFLMNYIKVQVDLSNLDVEFESAIQLFEILKNNYIIGNYTLKLSIYLLGMSVYEHVLLHDEINNLFYCAKTLVKEHSDRIDHDVLAIYYRNMGLCYPHSELKSEYFKSLLQALQITNKYQRHLIFGTSMNNLGLSYFYNGEIEKATALISPKMNVERLFTTATGSPAAKAVSPQVKRTTRQSIIPK